MKCVTIGFATGALVAGLIAANYWYRSSNVEIDPGWPMEPVIEDLKHSGWISAILTASFKAARLNKIAARWTALSVLLGSASSIIGSFDP